MSILSSNLREEHKDKRIKKQTRISEKITYPYLVRIPQSEYKL